MQLCKSFLNFGMPKTKKQVVDITQQTFQNKDDIPKLYKDLVKSYIEVEKTNAKDANAFGVVARFLTQTSLPNSNPGLPPGMAYTRTNGIVKMTVSSTTKNYGIPYGTIPRMVLAWICTEAKKKKSRVLDLGRSQREFLKKLGYPSDGATFKRVKDQCFRLFRAVISIEYLLESREDNKHKILGYYLMPIVKRHTVVWSEGDPDALWQNEVELSEDFFTEITSHAVPIDYRIYKALSKSVLAMDVYTWLTYRMFILCSAKQHREEVYIPWVGLMQQFGTNYPLTEQGITDFRKKFKKALGKVLIFFPELNEKIKSDSENLILIPTDLKIFSTPRLK